MVMGDLKARLRARFSRKNSATSSTSISSKNSENPSQQSSLDNVDCSSDAECSPGAPVGGAAVGSSGTGTGGFGSSHRGKKRASATVTVGTGIPPSPQQNSGSRTSRTSESERQLKTTKLLAAVAARPPDLDELDSMSPRKQDGLVESPGLVSPTSLAPPAFNVTPTPMHPAGPDYGQPRANDAGGNNQHRSATRKLSSIDEQSAAKASMASDLSPLEQQRSQSAQTVVSPGRFGAGPVDATAIAPAALTTTPMSALDPSTLPAAAAELNFRNDLNYHREDPPISPADFGTPTPRPRPAALSLTGANLAAPNLNGISHAGPPAANSPTTNLTATTTLRSPAALSRPNGPSRQQSLLPNRQTTLIRALLQAAQADNPDSAYADNLVPISGNMVTRKIWVKRPGASATLITINEDDLVDDVREMILRKYHNSLGRQFDAPDLTLRIVPREAQRQERMLGPEEPMGRTLDAYFPGGQTVDEALVIDVPPRRSPKPSPRNGPPHVVGAHLAPIYYDEVRPSEGGTDYFGPGAVAHLPVTVTAAPVNGAPVAHAISVLNTGQVPQIPSPGGARSRPYRERPDRPRLGRQHTSSPTILNVVGGAVHATTAAAPAANQHGMGTQITSSTSSRGRARTHSNASSDQPAAPVVAPGQAPPVPPPLPTPPAATEAVAPGIVPNTVQRVATPPPRVASPRPASSRPKKKKTADSHPTALPGLGNMLNGGVPPINVLIVEDNIINLKLLEAFVKRLKVRWQTAMNGQEAVNKWRAGGFHLVLMDIQLPVMSGLEATREIRRLERVNSIGVFSSTPNGVNGPDDATSQASKGNDDDNSDVMSRKSEPEANGEPDEKDKLTNTDMFKSPVIIVALTASSLQSDRHEALAAGCNDFLTKPVNFVWLERKVMEWGCMQALIDFDGWRKWKDYSQQAHGNEAAALKAAQVKIKKTKNRQSLSSS